MTRTKPKAKRYDYVQAIAQAVEDDFLFRSPRFSAARTRKALRKLVREAVREANVVYMDPDARVDDLIGASDRIAKRLVP